MLADPALGFYTDMAAVCLLAMRHLHPTARIVLVVDEKTAAALESARHHLREVATEVVAVATGLSDVVMSSRALKTTLRQRIKGDFLFLDADAVPVRSLAEGWPADVDLAAANDFNHRRLRPGKHVDPIRRKFDWTFLPARYCNTGVLWVRDTPAAHTFFEEWNRRWRYAADHGVFVDQPPFNSCLPLGLIKFGVLSDRENWMTLSRSLFRPRARVFHFFVSTSKGEAPGDTLLAHLVARYRATGQLDVESLERSANDNMPWTGNIGPSRLVFAGHYRRAAIALLRNRARQTPPG